MRRFVTIAASMLGAVALAAPVGLAGPADGPPESGAVTRFTDPGTQSLFDVSAAMGQETRPLVAVFNVASTEMFCQMGIAGAGDLHLVATPSGHRRFLLHDDTPVMIFDVTGLGSTHESVFAQLGAAICVDGLEPVATGVARVRNKVGFNGSNGTFIHVFDATGEVTDGEGTWSLTAHRRARGELPIEGPPSELNDELRLAPRGH